MKSIKGLSAALLLGLWLPCQVEAAILPMPISAAKKLATTSVEMAQYRGGAVRRGAAVGPRGGAVAGRGYVARGPRGAVAGRGYVARGPRGNVVAGRTTVARPGYRPVPVRPGWVRPPSYWWHPGMAVVSGAAIGFATAAAASAYANSQPPAPGYCWFYTNPQRTQGFWDVCPR